MQDRNIYSTRLTRLLRACPPIAGQALSTAACAAAAFLRRGRKLARAPAFSPIIIEVVFARAPFSLSVLSPIVSWEGVEEGGGGGGGGGVVFLDGFQ